MNFVETYCSLVEGTEINLIAQYFEAEELLDFVLTCQRIKNLHYDSKREL